MIRYRKLFDDVIPPHRAHDHDIAFDVHAYSDATLHSGIPVKVSTGLVVSVPVGYAVMVLPRSGMGAGHAVTIINSPGLVDPGYRGELIVALINHGKYPYFVQKGDRVAQLLVVQYAQADIGEGELHPRPDKRGPEGFGSTGK